MITTFEQMMECVKQRERQAVAVVCAHDLDVLLSLEKATQKNIVKPILIGKAKEIKEIIRENSLVLKAEIIDCNNDAESAKIAVKMIVENKAQMLMKGLVQTSTLFKAVLNKEWGIHPKGLLSHIALLKPTKSRRFLILTDGAINIAPGLEHKKKIIENAVDAAKKLGIAFPKVALLAAVESVNSSMQETLDAAILSKMNERGQIKGCLVDGPLALDNAVSLDAAKHKGIKSSVAGKADILIAPTIEVGNVIYKALGFLSKCEYAGVVVGACAPIILTSRADSADSKFRSIVLASTLITAK